MKLFLLVKFVLLAGPELAFPPLSLRSPCAAAVRVALPSGVLQLDPLGRPVHLASPGLIWSFPTSSDVGVRAAVLPKAPSVPLAATFEPNLHYGTLQMKDGTLLGRPPPQLPPEAPPGSPL